MKKLGWIALVLALAAAPAYAETLTGTVTNVDPSGRKLTLTRSDNQETVTVSVKDAGTLGQAQTGNTVTLTNANKGILGGWEADSLTVSGGTAASAVTNGTPSTGSSAMTGGGSMASETAGAGTTGAAVAASTPAIGATGSTGTGMASAGAGESAGTGASAAGSAQ